MATVTGFEPVSLASEAKVFPIRLNRYILFWSGIGDLNSYQPGWKPSILSLDQSRLFWQAVDDFNAYLISLELIVLTFKLTARI